MRFVLVQVYWSDTYVIDHKPRCNNWFLIVPKLQLIFFLTFIGVNLLNFRRSWRVQWVDLIMLFIWSIHMRCWSNMTHNSFKFAFCWIDWSEQRMRRLLSSALCLELSHDKENRIDWSFSQLNIRLFCCFDITFDVHYTEMTRNL